MMQRSIARIVSPERTRLRRCEGPPLWRSLRHDVAGDRYETGAPAGNRYSGLRFQLAMFQ